MKRHEKPYRCTVEGCSKPCGSKSDWKRHENTQHQLPEESWKCDEKLDDGVNVCKGHYDRREDFKQHLIRDHQIEEATTVEHNVESHRLCEARFWCGFCLKVIDNRSLGHRKDHFDHIDDHLNGRQGYARRHMSEFVFPQTNRAPAVGPAADSQPRPGHLLHRAAPAGRAEKTSPGPGPGVPPRPGGAGRAKRKAGQATDRRSAKRHAGRNDPSDRPPSPDPSLWLCVSHPTCSAPAAL